MLPDSLTLPLLWVRTAGLARLEHARRAASGESRGRHHRAAGGYLSLWCVYQLFRLVTGKEGMGYGDFKLLAALGAWLGWRMLLPIIVMPRRRRRRGRHLA